jgi:two-component system nitrate/nitrite response regulator NarL
MGIKVLVADDSAVMRRAIKAFLENRSEILLVGEAEGLTETIRKSGELHPEVIVLDLHLPECSGDPANLRSVLSGAKLVAITFAPDQPARDLAELMGAEKLIDKMDLVAELIPAIMHTADNCIA